MSELPLEAVLIADIYEADLERLRAENKRLREALQWYGDSTNWTVLNYLPVDWKSMPVNLDHGERARKALAGEVSGE